MIIIQECIFKTAQDTQNSHLLSAFANYQNRRGKNYLYPNKHEFCQTEQRKKMRAC